MEISLAKQNIPLNTLLCLEYTFPSHSKNFISYSEQIAKYTQSQNINFNSLFKTKKYFQSSEDSSSHKSESDDNKKFRDKRNYKEEEFFISVNNKELNNNFLNNKHINPYQLLPQSQNSEKEEEIERIILNLNSKLENKLKIQNIRKIVAYFKKNRNDKFKLSNFLLKLSQQIKEDVILVQTWVEYEYIKHKIENCIISIHKEITKYSVIISSNNNIHYNENNIFNANATNAKQTIQTIQTKYEELMQLSRQENELLERYPKIITLSEKYNHIKLKKKNVSYREKLIKKSIEIFAKSQIKIDDEGVINLFFSNQLSFEITQDEHNNNMNSISYNQGIISEGMNLESKMNSYSKDAALLNEESFPPKGKRYKVKPFNEEDFEIIMRKITRF